MMYVLVKFGFNLQHQKEWVEYKSNVKCFLGVKWSFGYGGMKKKKASSLFFSLCSYDCQS